MRRLIALIFGVPLMADSFLTSTDFYTPSPVQIGPWTQEMLHDLYYGKYFGRSGEPELKCTAQDIMSVLEGTDNLLTHMFVLQAAYYLNLNGFLDDAELYNALLNKVKPTGGKPINTFDLGFYMVLFRLESDALREVEIGANKLNTPEARLGYALCLAQIDGFGSGGSDWDSPSDLKCKAVAQLKMAVKKKSSWSKEMTLTMASAVGYMSGYPGFSGCKGWDEVLAAVGLGE
ncbi:MAG: hypothetical protein ABIM19_05420 [candidate division WOR-3 bacterium]